MRVVRAGDRVRAGMALIGADGAYAGLVVGVVTEGGRVVHIEATRPRGRARWLVPVVAVVRVVDQAVRLSVNGDADPAAPFRVVRAAAPGGVGPLVGRGGRR